MNVIMLIIYTVKGFLTCLPMDLPTLDHYPRGSSHGPIEHPCRGNSPYRTKGAQSVTITKQSTCKIYKSNRLMPGHYSKAISVSLQKVDYTTSPSNGQEKINGGHMANCLHCCPITNLWTQLRVRISEVGFNFYWNLLTEQETRVHCPHPLSALILPVSVLTGLKVS